MVCIELARVALPTQFGEFQVRAFEVSTGWSISR